MPGTMTTGKTLAPHFMKARPISRMSGAAAVVAWM